MNRRRLVAAGIAVAAAVAWRPASAVPKANARVGYLELVKESDGELLYRANRLDEAWEQYHAVVRDRYGAGSSWAAHWGTSDIVETTLRGQAGHWHRQAMKTESAETLDRAGVAYETYLAD